MSHIRSSAGLTDAGVAAAARFGTRHSTKEDFQLGIKQCHVLPSKDLHTGEDQRQSV